MGNPPEESYPPNIGYLKVHPINQWHQSSPDISARFKIKGRSKGSPGPTRMSARRRVQIRQGSQLDMKRGFFTKIKIGQ